VKQTTTTTLSDLILWNLKGCEKVTGEEYGKDECYWGLGIESNSSEICSRIQDSQYKDDCYWNVGIAWGDASICGRIVEQYPKMMCEALTQKNPGICGRVDEKSNHIPDQDEIDLCHALIRRDIDFCRNNSQADGCYFLMSRLMRNRTLCEEINSNPSQYSLCVRSFNTLLSRSTTSTTVKEGSECEKIANSEYRLYCYAITMNDAKMCEQIKGVTDRDNCFTDIAEAIGDADTCEQVQDAWYKDICYLHLSLKSDDRGICDKIRRMEDRYDCYASVGLDAKMCDKIEGLFPRSKCYKSVALRVNDSTICDRIEDNDVKDECYFFIANPQRNSSLCDKIKRVNKEACYIEVAVLSNDAKLCDMIGEPNERLQCDAILQKNLTICEGIDDDNVRYGCYTTVAFALNDSSMCSNIKNTEKADEQIMFIRDGCYSSLAEKIKEPSICNEIESQGVRDGCHMRLAQKKA